MTHPLLLALASSPVLAQDPPEDRDPNTLVRVDIPDWPGALATSHRGSVLDAPPPAGVPWRFESVPEPTDWTPVGDYAAFEAAEAIAAGPWHDRGWRGQGVKLAVFDVQWFGSELRLDELGDVRTQDCWVHTGCTPAIDSLRPRFSFEQGAHGLACAEVVRDLAPDVELYLVRVNSVTSFENALRWASREGIDLATLSMSFFNNAFYDGTGPVADAVEEMTEGGVLLVTSAGNYADGHWVETFTDTDGDGLHEFAGGSERLPVRIRADRAGPTVIWDNFERCGATDFDVALYDASGVLRARGDEVQDVDADRCKPIERLAPTLGQDEWMELELRRVRGEADVRFNIINTRGEIEGSMPLSSVTDPGTHPAVFTVGAVRADGYLDNGPEAFSSWGPSLGGHLKPDLAAPDGVTTSVYGPTGFFGTSAASPAAAAAIALVMSRDPDLDAFEAAEVLKGWAVDDRMGWQAWDDGLGAGRLRLPPPDQLDGCGGGWRGAWIVLPFAFTRRTLSRRNPSRRRRARRQPRGPL